MKTGILVALLAALPVSAAAQHDHGAPAGRSSAAASREQAPTPREPDVPDRIIESSVTAAGFVPDSVTVKSGQRVRLVVTRRTDETKVGEFILDEFLVWLRLPAGEHTSVTFTTGQAGSFPFRSKDGVASGLFNVVP